jgi:low affinity Fe/Cu permease
MRTIITSVALAACATVFAQNNAVETPKQDPVQQEPVPHVQSIYDECLLTAGTSSWKALGLNDDQVVRVSELQNRYKQSAKAAEEKAVADEKAAAKGKGKVKKEAEKAPAAASVEPKKTDGLTAEQPEVKQVDPQVEPALKDNTALEPPVENGTMDKEEDFSAATGSIPPMEYSPLDAELRSILTPAQLALWERRCDNRTSFQP